MCKTKNKYSIERDKKITNAYCKEFTVFDVIEVLRKDGKSKLWEKIKSKWTVEDWKEFFKLKIDNYETE